MSVFYYQKDGNVIGPMTGIDLREAAFTGAVLPATLISNNKGGPWFAAGRADGFFNKEGKPLPHPRETLQEIKAIRVEQNGSGSPHAQGEQAAPSPTQPVAAAPIQPVAAAPIQPVAAAPIQPVAAAPIQPVAAAPIQPVAAAPIQPSAAFPASPPLALPTAAPLPPTLPAAAPPPDPSVLAIDPSLVLAATSGSASGEHSRNESYLNQAQVSIHEDQRKKVPVIATVGFGSAKFIIKCVLGVVITIGLVVFGRIVYNGLIDMKEWRGEFVEKNMQRKTEEWNMRNNLNR